jgi:hypothetical protein
MYSVPNLPIQDDSVPTSQYIEVAVSVHLHVNKEEVAYAPPFDPPPSRSLNHVSPLNLSICLIGQRLNNRARACWAIILPLFRSFWFPHVSLFVISQRAGRSRPHLGRFLK